MTTREQVQQLCDADKRRRTSALRDAAMYIKIQDAIDAEANYMRDENRMTTPRKIIIPSPVALRFPVLPAIFSEYSAGYAAYIDRKGPGHSRIRAAGWLQAYRDERRNGSECGPLTDEPGYSESTQPWLW